MDNLSSDRMLVMRFGETATGGGEVFLSVLKEKTDALLKIFQNIALSVDEQMMHGRVIKKSISALTDLVIKDAKSGSLTLEMEVPQPDQLLIDDQFDIGLMALRKFKRIVTSIVKEDKREFLREMPDSRLRNILVKSFEKLYPRDGDNYCISFGHGNGSFFADIDANSKQAYKKMTDIPEEELSELRKITGRLVEIRAFAGKRHIAIKSEQKEIACYYTEMEDEISQLVCGSIVEVIGEAQVDKDGKVKQIDRIQNIEMMDLTPLKISKFVWQDKRFVLNRIVAGNMDYRDNIWVYEIPRYNLYSYSEDRKEAFSLINEQFAFQFEDLCSQPDEKLSKNAIKLKNLLAADVERVEENKEQLSDFIDCCFSEEDYRKWVAENYGDNE